jgi:NinB protein
MSERGYIVDKCPHCSGALRQRSSEQNSRLHALLSDIAEQKQWAGKSLDVESWKRLMVAAWCRANQGNVEIVPAIDGHGFDVIYRRTSRFTKQEMSELIEFATSWAIDQGITLHDPVEA